VVRGIQLCLQVRPRSGLAGGSDRDGVSGYISHYQKQLRTIEVELALRRAEQ
jgi:hypothetical protein